MLGRKFLLFLFILPSLAALAFGADAIYLVSHPAVVVEWSTASELDTVGFNLYRSEDQKGVFGIVNNNLIPSSSDTLVGGNYTFRDTSVKAGHTYYYLLEDVDANGGVNRSGPIQVTAESGGIPETAMAGLLSLLAVVSLYHLLRNFGVKHGDVPSVE